MRFIDVAAACRLVLLLSLFNLLACSDGRDGLQGPPGPAIPGVTGEAKSLQVDITSVTIDGAPVVEFSVRNEAGIPYVGLGSGNVRANLAKLVPGTSDEPGHWQNYLNQIERAGGAGPGTTDTIQATAERNGTFENHGNGTYTYTFATDVTNVTEPVAVPYEPQLTHRLAMQISGGGVPVSNPVYDWRPADGATESIAQHDIVATASCNECHGDLALHGGGRIETRYCVTCHNPGTTDANSGNTVDFKVMIHKIHRGEALPSVEAGGQYVIYGHNDSRHDYSDVALPMDIRNCSKCHDGSVAATPQGDNWKLVPSAAACGSCHDNVNFDTGANHGPTNLVATNSECTICHTDGGMAGSVAQSHRIPAQGAAARYQYNILDVTGTEPGATPRVRFSITDPGNANAPYDLASDPAWTQLANRASRLAVIIGWDTVDHHNTGSGRTPAQPVSIDALTASTANGDGSYSVSSPVPIPSNISGSGAIAIEGHPAADFDGDGTFSERVPVTSVLKYFPITDAAAEPRRQVVDIAKCDQCHGQLSLHGNNRTDEPRLCVICHNPNATDVEVRPADPATAADGLAEQSIDFKRMIHAIHGAAMREKPFVVYGFGGSVHDFSEVGFPGILSRCETCHEDGTYTLPLAEQVLASTVDTGGNEADPGDDLNISATAAVCSACHDSDLATTHMEQNGASFMTPQSMVDNGSVTETCAVCHGEGRIAAVDLVHGD